MRFRFWTRLLYQAAASFFRDNCDEMAAAISFYVLFSLFPLLILFVSVIGTVLQQSELQQEIIDTALSVIPVSGDPNENIMVLAIRDITTVDTRTIGILGTLGLAWSASSMFGAVRRSVNIAYGVNSTRTFFHQKLIDFMMVFIIGAFFLISIGTTAALEAMHGLNRGAPLLEKLSFLKSVLGEEGLLWSLASKGIPFLFSVIGFCLTFSVVPAFRFPFKSVLLGSVLASVLFETAKVGFVFYIKNFSRYDLIFGSLGGVIFFLLWVYISALILLFSAEIISEHGRLTDKPSS